MENFGDSMTNPIKRPPPPPPKKAVGGSFVAPQKPLPPTKPPMPPPFVKQSSPSISEQNIQPSKNPPPPPPKPIRPTSVADAIKSVPASFTERPAPPPKPTPPPTIKHSAKPPIPPPPPKPKNVIESPQVPSIIEPPKSEQMKGPPLRPARKKHDDLTEEEKKLKEEALKTQHKKDLKDLEIVKESEAKEEPESEEDILEMAYKGGLTEKDKKRKKHRNKILLLLLLLLLFGGTVSATYFILNDKEDNFIPDFNDNVVLELDDLSFQSYAGGHMPDSVIEIENGPLKVTIPTNTSTTYYDIVALGVSFSAVLADDMSNITDYILVKFTNKNLIYNYSTLTWEPDDYIYLNNLPSYILINQVLEPQEGKNWLGLVDSFKVSSDAEQERFADKTIRITISIDGIYPSKEKIQSNTSPFTYADEDWITLVENQAKAIFERRKQNARQN